MVVVVHHLNNSRSQRVLWLLEELGVEYEVKRYERDPKTMLAPKELKAVHPLGKSPVITDGDKTIAESGAIVGYIIGTYGDGRMIPPMGDPNRLRYIFWRHHAEGSAMPPLVMKLVLGEAPKSRQLPFFLRPVARMLFGGVVKGYVDPQIATLIAFWAAELEKSHYFAGEELTGADIAMSFPLEAAAMRAQVPPRITAYLKDIHGRPAYKRALERGGPYALAGG